VTVDGAGSQQEAPVPDEEEPAGFPAGDEISGEAGGAANTLMRLLSRHPFMALYEIAASKVRRDNARGFLLFVCVCGDLLFTLVVVALLLAIIGAVVYKTLAPLPHF
jgi:hypothetical protein